jgi:hypothetical protein
MKKSELRQIIREELYAELSENEQLDEINLKQGALAALLALASFTGKAQDKVGPNIDNSKIASAVTNFQSAYRKTGDEKFNVDNDDVKTMTGEEFEELMLAAFAERGVMAKGSPELQQRMDSLRKVHGPNAQFGEIFRINYLAPVENKSAFELAFAKAHKEGMDTFEFEGKTYKVEMDKTGKSTSGKVEVKILPAGKRTQVNPQNESKLRNIIREVLKGK